MYDRSQSTGLHHDILLPMKNPEVARRTARNPLFETTRTDWNEEILISAWEAVLNNESKVWLGEVPAGGSDEPNTEQDNCPKASRCTSDEDMSTEEVKYAVRGLVTKKMLTMNRKSLDNKLPKSLHNAQSGIPSVVCNVINQLMMDLLHKGIIGDTSEAHIVKFLSTDGAAIMQTMRLLTSKHSWRLWRPSWDAKRILLRKK